MKEIGLVLGAVFSAIILRGTFHAFLKPNYWALRICMIVSTLQIGLLALGCYLKLGDTDILFSALGMVPGVIVSLVYSKDRKS